MSDGFSGIEQLLKRLGELALDASNVERPLRAAGVYMVGSIEKNFQAQGRPTRWTPLSARTLAGRRVGKGRKRGKGPRILINSARMKNSVSSQVHLQNPESYTEVGTNVIYAPRQHFGYQGKGKGRGQATTPARPFVMFQDEDFEFIERLFGRHIERS